MAQAQQSSGLSSCSGQTDGSMVYVAFLRGINVGGKAIVSMAVIKGALVDLGLSEVRTYINSGNVIFSTRASDTHKLGARLDKVLENRTGMRIKVLVMDHKGLKKLVDAIPQLGRRQDHAHLRPSVVEGTGRPQA